MGRADVLAKGGLLRVLLGAVRTRVGTQAGVNHCMAFQFGLKIQCIRNSSFVICVEPKQRNLNSGSKPYIYMFRLGQCLVVVITALDISLLVVTLPT